MPRTKKTEEAVEMVKAVAETAKETVKTAAENAVEKAEVVVEKAKTAAKKVAKPRTKKTDDAAAKKTAKADQIETKVVIELADKSATSESLITRAKEDWTAKGNSLDEVKELALYINANEGMVYYVVNDDYLSGSFAI